MADQNGLLSIDDFAAKVKAKYPDYAHLGNSELAQKIVSKHPEYASQVDLRPLTTPPAAPGLPIPAGLQQPNKSHARDLSTDIAQANTPGILGGNSGTISDPGIQSDMAALGDTKPHNKRNFGLQVADNVLGAEPSQNEHDIQESAKHMSGVERAGHVPVVGPHIVTGAKAVDAFGKGHASEGLGYTGATALPLFGPMAAGAGEKFGEGDVKGGLADVTAGVAVPKILEFTGPKYGTSKDGPQSSTPTPDQTKAFNVLHPDNAVTDNSILPEIRNAAAQEAARNPANPITSKLGARPKVAIPKGKAGVNRIADLAQNAIDTHEGQVQSIKAPFEGAAQDNSGAANAALSKITPEMRIAAASDPGVANQIAQIEAIAARARGANTVGLTDQLRHSWNDDLASEMSKTAARQDVSPAATQAKKAAADALRQGFYDNLSKLSGQDVRPLAQREGQLIEAKAGLTKTGETALKSRGNDTSRAGQLAKAASRVSLTKPASIVKAIPDIIQAAINPEANTPVGQYTARVKRSLADLPEPTNFTPYQAPAPPSPVPPQLGPGPIPLGPSSEDVVPSLIQSFIDGQKVPITGEVISPKTAPVSDKIGGAKVLKGDVPLTGPVSPRAAEVSRLQAELKNAIDPKERADIQEAIDYLTAGIEGKPFHLPEQAVVENLPAAQPREIDPGTYNRETGVHTPGRNAAVGSTLSATGVPEVLRKAIINNGSDTPLKEGPRVQPNVPKKSGNDLISVIHPDGTPGTIPSVNLEAALSRGYRLAEPLG